MTVPPETKPLAATVRLGELPASGFGLPLDSESPPPHALASTSGKSNKTARVDTPHERLHVISYDSIRLNTTNKAHLANDLISAHFPPSICNDTRNPSLSFTQQARS
jgi:hypothetical protein